ncbi:putative protein kinase domain protein [Monocercomonoides exilis]|uniref:putative protein kinase domain protein n=1 Tax=Monocercomonoides exilis TaxID=2049356 RepID=UPI003559EBAF|nr:putative protein kinase domain protein [Monocercomonoides exilis]|eukprot:MONOS_6259.1-p1 / transcript=MONOS_6259.1 / gene=MONOS_6259 / organism=Monocercomonoides_exilis_PA203 / gene_product=Endothelin-converting enzyme 2 D (Ece2D) / transcript_product=Endothelin-converting enzyme 2 D (Ece2D) / location=Mono_scaffold00194:82577-83569(+) / protein_length=228 / sequence_SO=supercontig / SO=protein_coding / is_pseudo=false
MAEYGKLEYWEQRYSEDPNPFEWYQRYIALKPIINAEIKKDANILHIGCGTSRVGEEMYADGYQHIVNTDFSPKAIEIMKAKVSDKPGLQYAVEDVLDLLEQPESQYDAVIGKGCFDSILCTETSFKNAQNMLAGVAKVLKPGGVYVEISYKGREDGYPYFQTPELPWKAKMQTIIRPKRGMTFSTSSSASSSSSQQRAPSVDDGEVHYIYICKKHSAKEEDDQSEQ